MQKILFLSLFPLFLCMCIPLCASAARGGDSLPKKAILLVAFGTSIPEAQRAFDLIDEQARQIFPEQEIRWAYTSRIIRAKLAKQGKLLDSPEVALARMMDEGYTHVAVLSLHVFPGKEFHDLYSNAKLFSQMADGFKQVAVAPPLLNSYEDMNRVARRLLENVPFDRSAADAVLFMGHGNEKHPAEAMYAAMDHILQGLDPNAYVGTVQGNPTLDEILPRLVEKKTKKVYLIPFMAVAGDHARKDMAGDAPDSWKSVLTRQDIQCETVMKGIAEYPQIVDVWMDHLRQAFSSF